MRLSPAAVALAASLSAAALPPSSGFVGGDRRPSLPRRLPILRSTPAPEAETPSPPPPSSQKKKRKLGLVTFDLDDTLYPIAPVLDEANAAFSAAMATFGYVGIGPDDIVETGKAIRAGVSQEEAASPSADPLRPATVNHKEIRMAAIRKEMEGFILKTILDQTAADWATEVESLTSPVRKSAEKWARTTVHSSVVQAVYNAWEMERHHAAERHLFPDAVDAVRRLKEDHPDVIVGAVTDGSANPMLMVFSLMPLFDFTVSWEDDLESVRSEERFQELGDVERSDGLSWIYRLAVEKGREMSDLAGEIQKGGSGGGDGDEDFEWAWVHVGDDLAYDVGGSATTGARTVHVDLAPEYGQTARLRREGRRPAWTTETEEELEKHRAMSINALDKVDATITHLGQLPEAINELMKGGGEEEEAGGE